MTKDPASNGRRSNQSKSVPPRATYSLELATLVQYSKIAEEKFEGLEVVRTDYEQSTGSLGLLRVARVSSRFGLRRAD